MALTLKTRDSIFVFVMLFVVFLTLWMVPLYVLSIFPATRLFPLELRLVLFFGTLGSAALSYQLARRIAARLDRTPTQAAEDWNVIFAENLLGVPEEFKRLLRELREAADAHSDDLLDCAQRLAMAVDDKDPYTAGHSLRVTHYAVLIAEELGITGAEAANIRIAAQLHDIGKIAIDNALLQKPGALSSEEFEIIKRHPVVGANLLRPIRMLRAALPGVEYHHESLDGRGYPHGLAGEQIPRQARIITVADTFDAMTTDRPYQAAMEAGDVLRIIHSLGGKKFDVEAVDALMQIHDRDGLGTSVAGVPSSTTHNRVLNGFDSAVHTFTAVLSEAALQMGAPKPATPSVKVLPEANSLSA